MQNIDEFAFSTLTRRKPRSIPDTQGLYERVTVFPRDPSVLVAVAPIDAGLIQCSLPQWLLALKLRKQLVESCISEGLVRNPIQANRIDKNTSTKLNWRENSTATFPRFP
jgi:hypothetical protein